MRQKKKSITSLLLLIALALTVTLLPANTMTAQAAKKVSAYKVVYKLNGGTNNKANPKKLKKNKSAKLKAPTRNGYIFKGWYKDKKFKTKTTKVKGTKSAKNRTVYAKWEKDKTTAPDPGKPDAGTKPDEIEKPGNTPSKPTNPDNNTGNTGDNTGSTTPTTPSKPLENPADKPTTPDTNTGSTKPTTPSKPLENPADMYCIDGRNDTHNWESRTIGAGLHYYCACGFDIDKMYIDAYQSGDYDLANKYFTCGVDDPYLYDDEKMPCPGCGGWCNSDAGHTGVVIKQDPNKAEIETKCTRCGQVRPDWWVSTSKN